MDKFLKAIGYAVIFGGMIILIIPLSAIFGYFAGIILNWFVGDWIVEGLNLLFNTTRFTNASIPVVCATLAVVGGYLRTSVTTNNN